MLRTIVLLVRWQTVLCCISLLLTASASCAEGVRVPTGDVKVENGDFYLSMQGKGIVFPDMSVQTTAASAGLKTILNGLADPIDQIGVDGDFYINTTTNMFFGPKIANVWPAGISLVGPQGPPGTSGGSGTVTSVAVSGGTTGLTTSGGPVTKDGTIIMAGTLGIANGGTGATTQAAAANAILPSQTSNVGKFLTTNGSAVSWGAPSGGIPNSVRVVSGNTLVGSTENYLVVTSSNSTVTFPNPASNLNRVITILAPANFNAGTQTLTVSCTGKIRPASLNFTINNSYTYDSSDVWFFGSIVCVSDGTYWYCQ